MPTTSSVISKINKSGALLVFPLKSNPKFPSLWNALYPNKKMSWDWSEDGDSKVADLWHLRTKLSISRKVIYSKWFKNRATVFSLTFFKALLSLVSSTHINNLGLSLHAKSILSVLEDDSPLATKELKRSCQLEGQENKASFEQAMKQLWLRCLIIGYGEVEEGGYPSLAVGSSRLLFEDEWDASQNISRSERHKILCKYFLPQSDFYSYYLKLEKVVLQASAGG